MQTLVPIIFIATFFVTVSGLKCSSCGHGCKNIVETECPGTVKKANKIVFIK